jgi:hypothetical protein
MKKTLFAAALAVAGFVLPAHATPTVEALFAAIEATGTSVVVDASSICTNKHMLGMYEPQKDQLTICLANHKGDHVEAFDTLLHESVHIAQVCKGGPLFSHSSIAREASHNELKTLQQFYPADQHVTELEARVIARQQDEVYVTDLLKEHCK